MAKHRPFDWSGERGDGYVLEVQIPLSGEKGDFMLGQMDRTGEASNSGSDAW